MTERRHCTGTTKQGAPCKAAPLKDDDRCSAHTLRPDRTRFGSPAQASAAGKLGGRPPLPKPTDVARRLIEENVHRILRPHFLALGLDISDDGTVERRDGGAVMFGESKDGDIVKSGYEDLGAQMAAAEKLLDRVYGKPKQATEISGPEGGPVVTVELPTAPEWQAQVAKVLLETGALAVAAPNGNGNGSVNGNGHGPDPH
jgi:hypothetical protein